MSRNPGRYNLLMPSRLCCGPEMNKHNVTQRFHLISDKYEQSASRKDGNPPPAFNRDTMSRIIETLCIETLCPEFIIIVNIVIMDINHHITNIIIILNITIIITIILNDQQRMI